MAVVSDGAGRRLPMNSQRFIAVAQLAGQRLAGQRLAAKGFDGCHRESRDSPDADWGLSGVNHLTFHRTIKFAATLRQQICDTSHS